MDKLFELLGTMIAVALVGGICLALVIALAASAAMPFIKEYNRVKEIGPWVVKLGNGYLIFYDADRMGVTTITEHANKFNVESEAEEWAKAVGGVVVPWAKVEK